ncbi:hypothetical protein F5Y09DRAFT_326736 [Xylaria sp. FL1042]|nr:hypothetical protein F5Y09DRAFT_326736 [Xylaria sp. FL1042]
MTIRFRLYATIVQVQLVVCHVAEQSEVWEVLLLRQRISAMAQKIEAGRVIRYGLKGLISIWQRLWEARSACKLRIGRRAQSISPVSTE